MMTSYELHSAYREICMVYMSRKGKEKTMKGKKEKLGVNAMKRVAAGAHFPTPWLFEPAERPDDRADYCLCTRR